MKIKKKKFRLIKVLFLLVSLSYPLFLYFGLERFGLGAVFTCLAILSFLKILLTESNEEQEFLQKMAPFFLIVLAIVSFVFDNKKPLLFYPLIINFSFLIIFVSSLFQEKTFVEKLARITDPELPAQAIVYTRVVTIVWSVFFFINSLFVLYSIYFSTFKFWTFYNGFLSYIIIGGIFSVEFIVRMFMKKKWSRQHA